MSLTDAHCHLQAPELTSVLPEVWSELAGQKISRWVVNGLRETDWPRVAELARDHAWVRPSFGLHPWYLAERSADWLERLEEIIVRHPGCGVGEFGLDRWMRKPDAEDQRKVFQAHWRLARRHHLPASIHCLRAWGTLAEELDRAPLPERGFLLHAYGGPAETVADWVKRGAYFSFSPAFLAADKLAKRETFLQIPLERLLVETDAPAMAPPAELNRFSSGEAGINHPGNLLVAIEGLAELRGIPLEEFTEILEDNFLRWWGNA